MNDRSITREAIAPWSRVVILLTALASAFGISYVFTGAVLPTSPEDALIFQNALLLVVLGSAILEHHFTKPADSAVNSLMGVITLATVYKIAPSGLWWLVFAYCSIVFLMSITCVSVSSGKNVAGWRRKIAEITYKPSVVLGRARLLFSVVFLFGLYAFYQVQSLHTIALVIFWGVFVVIWPLGIPQLLSSFSPSSYKSNVPIGELIRTDNPNLLRFGIEPTATWDHELPLIYQRADGAQNWVMPLYSHVQNDRLVGTAISLGSVEHIENGLKSGFLYQAESETLLNRVETLQYFGEESDAQLIGFIIENSEISEIRFEAWNTELCKDGILVWCRIDGEPVYYQITNGMTKEESLESDRHGYQVATAAQLGKQNRDRGFIKYDWLPKMNTPIFTAAEGNVRNAEDPPESDFTYGSVPNSNIQVTGPYLDSFNYHTAILGVTGSGKTELAFDVIRHALNGGIKVLCIDLTSQYKGRLGDLNPCDLSIDNDLASELSARLFDVETGKYGAGDEKKALNEFADRLRENVKSDVAAFIETDDQENRLGLIELREISNTKATLWITELYLTCLLHYSRDHRDDCPPILIVVEEAHTVMPEPNTMGLGDFDSKGLVGKISQIALQGRKYGVGLLVLAQRTATVSKTVLTQCNTIISFAGYDDTSLKFLSNIFGQTHVKLIPNLRPLQAVVFGKGVRSDRPILVNIPYVQSKADNGA